MMGLRQDWTENVINDLKERLFGAIPRNFALNISGLIGTPTGIFKSSMGLQLALSLDSNFSLERNVGFSVNDLLDKIQKYTEFVFCYTCLQLFKQNYKGEFEIIITSPQKCQDCGQTADSTALLKRQIYFLDEQTKSLKFGGLVRLQNIIDTNRQRQLCFITCGVKAYNMSFMTYELKRIQESNDDLLPMKRVMYAVYDPERDYYYGKFVWDITPLTNTKWNSVWSEYSKMKTKFQRTAVQQQIQAMDYGGYAELIMNNERFSQCFKELRDGRQILQSSLVKNLIIKQFPDMTEGERNTILAEIKLILNS